MLRFAIASATAAVWPRIVGEADDGKVWVKDGISAIPRLMDKDELDAPAKPEDEEVEELEVPEVAEAVAEAVAVPDEVAAETPKEDATVPDLEPLLGRLDKIDAAVARQSQTLAWFRTRVCTVEHNLGWRSAPTSEDLAATFPITVAKS